MAPAQLTPIQLSTARQFFQLPESAGFAVAGAAGLIARGLIDRPTQDIDVFLLDAAQSSVAAAAASFEAAMERGGWSHRRIIDQQEFVRFQISDGESDLIVDLGRDSPAEWPIGNTELGPTMDSRDLAARKTLALYSRAEPRDFADVYALARVYGRDLLLDWAASADSGFDRRVFGEMLASIGRLADEELQVARQDAGQLRTYFGEWASQLREGDP